VKSSLLHWGEIPQDYLTRVGRNYRTGVESAPIPLGPAPWNLYPARNVDTNGYIEEESFNLLKPDGTIPLGPFAISPGPAP